MQDQIAKELGISRTTVISDINSYLLENPYSKESGYFFSPKSEYRKLTKEIFSNPFDRDEDEPDFDI